MAVSQADIDALNSAIASGERVVVLNGQSVTYRSVSDLIMARNDLLQQINNAAQQASGKPRAKRVYAYLAGRGY